MIDDRVRKNHANLLRKIDLEHFERIYSEGARPSASCGYQLVTDYVCGMTDTFAKQLRSELMNG